MDQTPREIELANSDTNTRRRSFLRAAGGVAAAATGATAFSGTAAAVEVEDNTSDSLPVVDELLLYVHGWFGGLRTGDDTLFGGSVIGDDTPDGELQRLSDNLSQSAVGYSADAEVNYIWDAFSDTINYFDAIQSTEEVGTRLATLIEAFYDNGGGNIRLVGHSLGSPVVLHALNELGSAYTVETVALLAGANPQQSVCGDDWSFGWDFTDGIETSAETIRNYYSRVDTIVLFNLANGVTDFDTLAEIPVGFLGPEVFCSPSNWTDVDCTDAPREALFVHFDYFDVQPVGDNLARIFNGLSAETTITGNEYAITDGSYEIESVNPFAGYSPKIMEVSRADEFEGANVRLWEDWDLDNQVWQIEEVQQGGYRIAAQHTEMVLAPQFGDLEVGTTLVQEIWRGRPHQRWMLEPHGNSYLLRHIASGLVAGAEGQAPQSAGDDIRLEERGSGYGQNYNQEWLLHSV